MKKDDSKTNSSNDTASPVNQKPQPFEIPADGCLGLLALGYRGLELWA